MVHLTEHDLTERLREASHPCPQIMTEVITAVCRRFPSLGQSDKTARIERLIIAGAWTDASLALIDLELPLWRVRRLAYDAGEWHCALSCQRELPDWLDQCVEGSHTDLSLAILTAFVEVQRLSTPRTRASVPVVARNVRALCERACAATLS